MRIIDLYFPENEHGEASVGYTTLTVTDHHAMLEYDELDSGAREEAEKAKAHWERNGVTVTIVDEKGTGAKIVLPAGTFQEGEQEIKGKLEGVNDDNSS